MDLFTLLILWPILCILVGVFASSKGRSGIGYFFISIFLSPLIGFIIALVVKENKQITESKRIISGDEKKCPRCAELIKKEALVCRFCGNEFDSKDEKEPIETKEDLSNMGESDETNVNPCPKCKGETDRGFCGVCAIQITESKRSGDERKPIVLSPIATEVTEWRQEHKKDLDDHPLKVRNIIIFIIIIIALSAGYGIVNKKYPTLLTSFNSTVEPTVEPIESIIPEYKYFVCEIGIWVKSGVFYVRNKVFPINSDLQIKTLREKGREGVVHLFKTMDEARQYVKQQIKLGKYVPEPESYSDTNDTDNENLNWSPKKGSGGDIKLDDSRPPKRNNKTRVNLNDVDTARKHLISLPDECGKSNMSTLSDGTIRIEHICNGVNKGTIYIKNGRVTGMD